MAVLYPVFPRLKRVNKLTSVFRMDKWKQKFTELASQLDEIEGKAPAKAPGDDRDATQDRLAAKEPAMNVKIENKTVTLNYRNLSEVVVNYYPMDLEFLLRPTPRWRQIAEGVLFRDGDIVENGDAAEAESGDGGGDDDGPIVWAPGVRGAVVLSLRGGDFLFESGQDLSIGYSHHDAESVHLYLEESFSFVVATPEAAAPLSS